VEVCAILIGTPRTTLPINNVLFESRESGTAKREWIVLNNTWLILQAYLDSASQGTMHGI
jgi:hypothetical protein